MSSFAGIADWWSLNNDVGRTFMATQAISQTGLQLSLDAGLTTSYSGTGTTWSDISGNSFNATLTGSPAYVSDDSYYFRFNGSNQVAQISNTNAFGTTSLPPVVTLETWAYLKSGGSTQPITGFNNNANYVFDLTLLSNTTLRARLVTSAARDISIDYTSYLNKWTHIVFVASTNRTDLYLNGVLVGSNTSVTGNFSGATSTFYIGANPSLGYSTCEIAVVRYYNVALNSTQVTQNYKALIRRFQDRDNGWFYFVNQQLYQVYGFFYKNDNFYISGTTGFRGEYLAKINSNGNLVWYRDNGSNSNPNVNNQSIVVDSQENVYFLYYFASGNGCFFKKFDLNGNLIWSKRVPPLFEIRYGASIAIDSLDNIYLAFRNGSETKLYLLKINTNGSVLWQRTIENVTIESTSLKIDKFNNIFLMFNNTPDTTVYLTKFDTLGNLIFQKSIGDAGTNIIRTGNNIDIDNNNNIYCAVLGDSVSSNSVITIKLDSSGNLLWQRKQNRTPSYNVPLVSVDSIGNSYTIFREFTDNVDQYICKLDTNGNYVWGRYIGRTGSGNGDFIENAFILNNFIYVAGHTQLSGFNLTPLIGKIPTTGNKVGIFTSGSFADWNYSISSWAVSTSSLTVQTSSLTVLTSTYYSFSDVALSVATTSISSIVKIIF